MDVICAFQLGKKNILWGQKFGERGAVGNKLYSDDLISVNLIFSASPCVC